MNKHLKHSRFAAFSFLFTSLEWLGNGRQILIGTTTEN